VEVIQQWGSRRFALAKELRKKVEIPKVAPLIEEGPQVIATDPKSERPQRRHGWNTSLHEPMLTQLPCKERRASVYAVGMPKRPPKPVEISKVVPLTEEKRRVIASDQRSHRLIFAIGQKRYAFDFFTRITDLSPHTGDHPAPVLPISKKRRDK
jgi:hypothetical protein